ncbi:MAG TPA: BTAD domain-containing putative transcriptional regulator [Gemmatimonadaceae bacterium]
MQPSESPGIAAAAAAAPELPVHLTRLVGRERELADLAHLVGTPRLLTLTGAGGSGKTRLARATAERVASSFERVAWVDLSLLDDAQFLVPHVAAVLGAPERTGVAPLDVVVGAIGSARMLLVLDNCEHVVDACADVATSLLRACPRLAILATSREALAVAGETAWLVPPLASTDATQLFVERAQMALPSFTHSPSNGPAIAEICRRLDGIPLAIELAAARVRVLSPEQIARRLDDAFRLLTTGTRTALPRHRTLRATMDWSFGLLGVREQQLLPRLAVFSGSFSLEAAEVVCAGDPLDADDILDGVSALVDKSLVIMEAGDTAVRYRLLETVRQYGLERLAERGELDATMERHTRYFLEFVERSEPSLIGGSNAPDVFAHLVTEHDNIRAACARAVAYAPCAEPGLRFVGALFWFWYALGQFREARQLTDRALSEREGGDAVHCGRALVTSALIALAQGDYALSSAHFENALPLLRDSSDDLTIGVALAKLGAAQLLGGDVARAVTTLDQALELRRDAPRNDIARIFARFWRSWAAVAQGDHALARELALTNVQLGRDYTLPTTLGHSLALVAHVELARGNTREACEAVTEALEIEVAIGDGWGTAIALDAVALVAEQRRNAGDAVRLLAGIEAHRERIAVALPGIAPAERTQAIERLRATLGVRFDALYAEGRALATSELVSIALTEAARHTTEHRVVTGTMLAARRPASATRRIRVLALGPLQVFVGDEPVASSAWSSARPRELLVYLLMHPEGRTKEQVGLAFWPDASTAQVRNNFHVTLHRLRKALGDAECVTLTGDRYQMNAEMLAEFDAREFERDLAAARFAMKRQQEGAVEMLASCLARYRGDFLDGEPVGDWHLEHRDRLQRLYVDSLMELGARYAAAERQEKAAEAYRRVLARDDLHEDALVALMRCHAGLGERSQALRVYQRFADRMRTELDAAPTREATRLFERLQQST